MEATEPVKRVTVPNVPIDLWRQLKVHALEQDTPVQAVVVRAIEQYLKQTA